MRKIIYGINISIDGCCDHTKFGGSEETHVYFTDLLRDVDLIIYGRKTYELMVPYWPEVARNNAGTKTELDFAKTFNAIDKVVCSTSSTSVPDNTKVISENLAEEILKLKRQPGKNISLGGVSLPAALMSFGLVDEFYFLVHPIIVGQGKRLFDSTNLATTLNLKLADSKTLQSGCIALHYVKE